MISSSERAGRSGAYRAGLVVAFVTSLLTVWTTVVRGDGNGIGFSLVAMAAAVAGLPPCFRRWAWRGRCLVWRSCKPRLGLPLPPHPHRDHSEWLIKGLGVQRLLGSAVADIGDFISLGCEPRLLSAADTCDETITDVLSDTVCLTPFSDISQVTHAERKTTLSAPKSEFLFFREVILTYNICIIGFRALAWLKR